MQFMDFKAWLTALPGYTGQSDAADAAGVDRSTLSRQLGRNHLTMEVVVAIARAHGVKGADALLQTDYFEAGDVSLIGVERALELATNQQLLDEINTRVDPDSREKFRGEGQDGVIDLTPDVDPWLYAADSSPDEPEEGDDDYGGGA